MRTVVPALLALFLAKPEVRRTASVLDLWVLMDRSSSAREALEPQRAELEKLLENHRGAADRIPERAPILLPSGRLLFKELPVDYPHANA